MHKIQFKAIKRCATDTRLTLRIQTHENINN